MRNNEYLHFSSKAKIILPKNVFFVQEEMYINP